MPETRFTEGTWFVSKEGVIPRHVLWSRDNKGLLRVVANGVRENDASLLAASKDLYAALEALTDALAQRTPDRENAVQIAWEKALETIAKARGEAIHA